MIKIVLGEKKNVDRKGMPAVGAEARNLTVYYVLESRELGFSVATYEKVKEKTDKTLEIDGEHYKPIAYQATGHYRTIPNAIEGYFRARQLKPNKDITSIKELYTELLKLKKEAEKLYGLVGIK